MVTPLALALMLVSGQAAWRASTAPGPSSRVHENVSGNCDACHTPFKGVQDEKCLSCHKELKKFHAAVAEQKCVACHGEHHGPDADLTKSDARKAFDHALTGMALSGGHQKVGCPQCHTKSIDKMSTQCSSCHADVHKGAFGTACASCHSDKGWKAVLHPLAEHKMPMEGGHQGLKCNDCHAKGANLSPKVACNACHEQAHGGTTSPCEGCHNSTAWKPAHFDHSFCTCILPQKHQTVGCLGCHRDFDFKHAPSLCSGCHEKERKHEPLGECSLCHSAVSWKKNEFDHNKRSKFKLAGNHLKVACENCHPPQGKEMKFRGVPNVCEGCHQAQGDKAHGNFGPCAKCHTVEGFKPSSFDHASTGFPLVGRHSKLNCKECHQDKTRDYPKGLPPRKAELEARQRVLAWLPTSDAFLIPTAAVSAPPANPHGKDAVACSHCHADVHKGSTLKLGECSACHGFEAWKPQTFDAARHASTTFALTGKHAAVRCALCHEKNKFDDALTTCAGCHVDRHRGKLGDQCEKCHTTEGFKPAAPFDHAVTGFALVGGHAKVSCASCHEGKRGKAMAATEHPGECATCHQAKHGDIGAQCEKCHDVSKGPFANARGMAFPHEQTGFALERRHSALLCGSCHKAKSPVPEPRCGACHFDPHNHQLGSDCQDCHLPDRFRLVRFDHDKTAWPLRGKHFMVPCAKCHSGQRWIGLSDECWDCHSSDAARGKMKDPADHGFGPTDCALCHKSEWTWKR